jgi:hypothetical protein
VLAPDQHLRLYRLIARIALALAEDHRSEVLRLADDVSQQWPGDPDLTRMRATFPLMFLQLPRERFPPQRRGRN